LRPTGEARIDIPVSDYDDIGKGYARFRRPDPRIGSLITAALGDAKKIINVGAGAGSYEPEDREVVAIEPSAAMIAQRARPAILGCAESLPFSDRSFDVAMAVLTVHHWSDLRAGLAELRRVSERVVIVTWDPGHEGFWLVRDYFPDLLEYDRRIFPSLSTLDSALGGTTASAIPIPHDCSDGFLGAYWRRPERYLDDDARGAISTFRRIADVKPRIAKLAGDLASGDWARKNTALLERDTMDLGYRVVVSRALTVKA
jgi:SAM-dependent methyltransferase